MNAPEPGPRHSFGVWDSHLPPEFYGRGRDEVNLISVDRKSGVYSSSGFLEIVHYLRKGDLLVFNNSELVPSAVPVFNSDTDSSGWLHFGTSRLDGMVLVEPRPKSFNSSLQAERADLQLLGDRSTVRLERRHSRFSRFYWAKTGVDEAGLREILDKYGAPVSYEHIPFKLPMDFYRSAHSIVPGSAEFPSASRPFTERVMNLVERKGVRRAYLTLHCNLSPLEPWEFDASAVLLEEKYSISRQTADIIEQTASEGGRVIAVGTSVTRALEDSYRGRIIPGESATELFIRPGYNFKCVDALITGLHDPESSHVEMISAFLDDSLLRSVYSTASSLGYQWHEFGDLSFIA